MSKPKTTRQRVLDEGYRLAVEEGMDQVQVKIIARNLGCSVQPVYSYFKNMEDLKNEITRRAYKEFMEQVQQGIQPGENPLLAFAHSFAVQAQRSPRMFEYFKTSLASRLTSIHQLYSDEFVKAQAEASNLSDQGARELLEQFTIYLLGLAAMEKDGNLELEEALIAMQQAYDAFDALARTIH